MIYSMTGYGKAQAQFGSRQYTIEIRSLNSKGLDLNLKTPSVFRSEELSWRKMLGQALQRGKIDCSVYYEDLENQKKISFNTELIKAYYKELGSLQNDIPELNSNSWLDTILKLPETTQSDRLEPSQEEIDFVKGMILQACESFNVFRKEEGSALEEDFKIRVQSIETSLNDIVKYVPERKGALLEKLRSALKDLKTEIDENRFEQELIYYLEKLDLNEEIQRLTQHCKYFMETMENEEYQGKKLGFIAQEMGREINTIGSKANLNEIQKKVVQMKDELEKIKEQVLNTL